MSDLPSRKDLEGQKEGQGRVAYGAIPLSLTRLDRLDLPVPPEDLFERLFGYNGGHRFVGFYYAGSKLYFEDGYLSGTANFWPWAAWTKHHTVHPFLSGYNFGYDDVDHIHILLIDRVARKVYTGSKEHCREVLIRQDVPPAPVEMSSEEFQIIKEKLIATLPPPLSIEDIKRLMKEEQRRIKELLSWLDGKR